MKPRIERVATHNASGEVVAVMKVTPFENVGTLEAPDWIETLPWYQLANGQRLNVRGNVFVVPETGEELRRVPYPLA